MDNAAPAGNVDIACKVMEHLSAMNIDAMAPLFHEDAKLEMPFTPGGEPLVASGRNAVLAVFRGAPTTFDIFRIVPHEVWDCPARDTVIVEATSLGRYRSGKGYFQNRYGIVFRFENGLVKLYREYANPYATVA